MKRVYEVMLGPKEKHLCQHQSLVRMSWTTKTVGMDTECSKAKLWRAEEWNTEECYIHHSRESIGRKNEHGLYSATNRNISTAENPKTVQHEKTPRRSWQPARTTWRSTECDATDRTAGHATKLHVTACDVTERHADPRSTAVCSLEWYFETARNIWRCELKKYA